MIKAIALEAFETMLNNYLALDPEIPPQLNSLNQKVIKIDLVIPGAYFYYHFQDQKIRVLADYVKVVDAIIKGNPIAFALMWQNQRKGQTKFNGNVEIEGDVAIVQRLNQILLAIDIDWEEQLSKLIGDIAAHQIVSFTQNIQDCINRFVGTTKMNVTEYLQEESREFPPREEMQDFYEDVDDIRNDVERAQARINILEQQLHNKK